MDYCQLQSKVVCSNGIELITKCNSVLLTSWLEAEKFGKDFLTLIDGRRDSVVLNLRLLQVPASARNHGEGTFLMNSLIEILDCDKRWAVLGTNYLSARNPKRLSAFFAIHGFEECVLLKQGALIRRPRLVAQGSYETKSS